MGLQRKENNLRKAQARFEKVSRHSKQFKLRFERSQNSKGRFRTRANIVRDVKSYHGNNRGILHKTVNLKYRFEGDKPSITKTINNFQPKTFRGKLFKKSAQAINFTFHDTAKTAVDVALASETIGLKSADMAKREVANNLKQKYSREAVDDYHRGVFFMGKTVVDAVKGTHQHFKQKKQHKLEKAKFRLKKAEYSVFKNDTFKPKFQKNNADFTSAKMKLKRQKKAYKSGSKNEYSAGIFQTSQTGFQTV